MQSQIKAVVQNQYGTPDVLRITHIEKPVPEANQVLIKIHATTVETTDAIFRSGKVLSARMATGPLKPGYDIPGSEFAGEIEAIGAEVTRFTVGQRVFGTTAPGFGAHTEYIALTEDSVIAPIPDTMTYTEAVSIHPGALTALPNLTTANLQAGQKILINGASGSIGSSAVQLAKALGAEVTGVCSTANVELVKSLGADHVIDYKTQDFTQIEEQYDVIFDSVGKSSYSRTKHLLKPDGIYLTTVLSPTIMSQMLWTSKFNSKKAKIIFAGLRSKTEKNSDLAQVLELVQTGQFRPVIDRTYSFEQIADAHRYVDTGHKKGNVVVTIA